jgi:DNA repair protein RecO (recombination protein O)
MQGGSGATWKAGQRGKTCVEIMEQTDAILIGRSRYGETSLIVHWCAPEAGLFRTIAKGALRPKSPLGQRLDLFVSAELRWVRSRRSELHTLAEVVWKNPRLGLRSSYGRVLAATYLVKLVERVVEPQAAVPGLYELLTKALDYLAEKEPTLALVERFELRLAEDLGIATAVDAGQSAHLIEEAFHRKLPVQRRQLLEWLEQRRRGSGGEVGPKLGGAGE